MLDLVGEIGAIATAAGINPWIAAVLVLALDQVGWLDAARPFLENGELSDPALLGILILVLVVEQVADKIPGVDHLSDLIHLPVKPVMAAVLAVALLEPVVPWEAGPGTVGTVGGIAGVVALLTHLGKAGTRVASTTTTAGMGSPVLSVIEDLLAVALVVVGVLLPLVALVFIGLVLLVAARGVRALVRRKRATPQKAAPG